MRIEVEDARAGEVIMSATVGNCLDEFEIRVCDGRINYYVGSRVVPVEAYRDALQLAVLDRAETYLIEDGPAKECD